jgi:streptogramin lyase
MKSRRLSSWVHNKWGVAAALVAFLAVLGLAEARPSKTSGLLGLAKASGTVTSPSEFKAAKVYFRNPDKRMLYMVYTNAGKFQAMNLMPGNYEVSVEANGLESDVQKIELKAGSKATVNLSLHPAVKKPGTVQMLSYEELYPKGEGRTIAERTCIRCHGANFLPSKVQWDADRWNGAIDTMMAGASPAIPAEMLPKDKREVLVKYLVANFGPHSELRAISQAGMPVDETKISKAEYIEFYFPIDPPGFGHNDPQYSGLKNVSYGGLRTGQDVILDQQGYAWCTDRGTPNRIARLDPRTGEWMSFYMPHPTKGIHDFIIDNDGMIWVPEWLGPGNLVDVFDTKTLKWVASYPMDPDQVFKTVVRSQAIVIDSKHNVYMNWNLGSAMSRLDWQTKRATVTLMPNPQSFLYGVVKDSKDNIWISEFRGGKIARMDAVTQKITEFAPPTYPALIRRLTVDSKDMVWFDLYSAGKFDRLDPSTGKITEWDVPFGGSQPYSLKQALGSNKMWISDGGAGGALILFDPDTEEFTIYPTPQITDQPLMRIAGDGAVWYCPRSAKDTGIGVMYPDVTKMTTLAAYPTEVNPNY